MTPLPKGPLAKNSPPALSKTIGPQPTEKVVIRIGYARMKLQRNCAFYAPDHTLGMRVV
jgi:hypothetical protein